MVCVEGYLPKPGQFWANMNGWSPYRRARGAGKALALRDGQESTYPT